MPATETPPAATDDELRALHRPLAAWLRALWGETATLRAIRTGQGTQNAALSRAFVSNAGIHLPDVLPIAEPALSRRHRYATLAHIAAHRRFSTGPFASAGLKPVQQILLGLLEDARVEWWAMQELPGLRALWSPWHVATPQDGLEPRVLLQRMSRALLDPEQADTDAWVRKARTGLFPDGPGAPPLADRAAMRDLASRLGHDLGQMRLRFDPKAYVIAPAYRDDNAWLWSDLPVDASSAAFAEPMAPAAPADPATPPPPPPPPGKAPDAPARSTPPPRAPAALVERLVRQDEDDEDDEAAASPSGARPDTGPTADARADGRGAVPIEPTPLLTQAYPEWDYVIGRHRPGWAQVTIEAAAPADDATPALATGRPAPPRALRSGSMRRRERRVDDGDELDLDAGLHALVEQRARGAIDGRIWQRLAPWQPPLDLLMLIDASASTNDPRPGGGRVIDLLGEAARRGAVQALATGHRCAIAAFRSNTRHAVHWLPLMDFDAPLDGQAERRLAGLTGRYSTRFGAAIRHATATLAARRRAPRLLLLLTDGEPHDVDIFDRRYLIEDARDALIAARRQRIAVLGVTVDERADRYAERLFGRGGFVHLPHPESLSRQLPALIARLAR